MKILKVGIVGSRMRNSIRDKQLLKDALMYVLRRYPDFTIHLVSGGCPKGADSFAEELAEELGMEISIHYPDLSEWIEPVQRWQFAKSAYERNTLIADECDILIAIWDSKSRGTNDTIQKVDKLGKPVVLLD